MILTDAVVRLSLVGLGVACAALLWMRRPQAVVLVRLYLVLFAVVHFLLVFLPFLFGLAPDARNHVAGIYMYRAGMLVLSTCFWLLYLKHSRRVRATYGTTPAPRATA